MPQCPRLRGVLGKIAVILMTLMILILVVVLAGKAGLFCLYFSLLLEYFHFWLVTNLAEHNT